MSIISELKQRKIINNITNEEKLEKAISTKKAIYIGFDPSFKSLHLGNYIMICMLKMFKKAGIKAYGLIGGATGMIGDPSGKKTERPLLEQENIKNNISCLEKQIASLSGCEIINNYDFYKDMSLFDFLRIAGKLINVNYLLEKEIISTRLQTGISYAEFSYNLIQGYDFMYLYENSNVCIQMGGSDQWGNITTGLEMIRKNCGDDNLACGVTINLLTKHDGTKFGKSESGAIYLDKNITSPFEMYQFLINQADGDLEKLFNFFSFKTLSEIACVLNKHNENPSLRYGQKELAKEIVTAIHGESEYEQCLSITSALFLNEFEKLSVEALEIAFKQFKTFKCKQDETLCEFMITNNIITSKRIFRELLGSNGLSINGKLINADTTLNIANSFHNRYTIIKKGKKNYFIIDWKE